MSRRLFNPRTIARGCLFACIGIALLWFSASIALAIWIGFDAPTQSADTEAAVAPTVEDLRGLANSNFPLINYTVDENGITVDYLDILYMPPFDQRDWDRAHSWAVSLWESVKADPPPHLREIHLSLYPTRNDAAQVTNCLADLNWKTAWQEDPDDYLGHYHSAIRLWNIDCQPGQTAACVKHFPLPSPPAGMSLQPPPSP